MKLFKIFAFVSLAACGADGDPVPKGETGVHVSGAVTIGVGGSF